MAKFLSPILFAAGGWRTSVVFLLSLFVLFSSSFIALGPPPVSRTLFPSRDVPSMIRLFSPFPFLFFVRLLFCAASTSGGMFGRF